MIDPERTLAYYSDLESSNQGFIRWLPRLPAEKLISVALGQSDFTEPALAVMFRRAEEGKLPQLRDEDLILLILHGRAPWDLRARDFLYARHDKRTRQLVDARARKYHASHEDREDAGQHAYFAFEEAVRDFNPRRAANAGCTFGTFLYSVAVARLHNFCRHLGRVERPYNREVPLEDEHGEQSPKLCKIHFTPDGHAVSDGPVTDPSLLAEERELRARLAALLAELDDLDRGLYERIADGMKLPEAARELGLSYQQARRRWHRLFQRLRTGLATAAASVA